VSLQLYWGLQMAELKFGESLSELKKTVEKNRTTWKQVVATKQAEWQKKLKEKSDEISDFKTKSAEKETELLTELRKTEAGISTSEFERNNLSTKRDKLKEKLSFEQTERKKQLEKLHESTVITMKSEVVRRQEEANKKFRERELKCELSKLHIKELEVQVAELTVRLTDDQKRWQEVLRMKSEDFTALRNELVNRVKASQTEYKQEEKEVQILKDARQELENKVKERENRLRDEETKWRDQLTAMENETNKLKRKFEWQEKTYKKDLMSKEKDLEALKKEMDRFIEELIGGVKKAQSAEQKAESREVREQKAEEKADLSPVSTDAVRNDTARSVIETVSPTSRVSEEIEEENVRKDSFGKKTEPKKSFLNRLFGK